jgi:hypothetical protein
MMLTNDRMKGEGKEERGGRGSKQVQQTCAAKVLTSIPSSIEVGKRLVSDELR